MQETGVSAGEVRVAALIIEAPDVRTWGARAVRPGKMSCGTGMLWLVQWFVQPPQGGGGGGGVL